MTTIVSHDNLMYRRKWQTAGKNRFNGALYYSKEICKNIIPNVRTDRNWVTINIKGLGAEHSVVFVHNNLHPENYEWLALYDDVILVCGVPETVEKVSHIAKAIYLPLSIDVEHVKRFRVPDEDRHGTAFVGRPAKRKLDSVTLPRDVDIIEGMSRAALLQAMARYENVYAVGRTAIEAKVLGCNVLPYDERFPDPDRWAVIDNREAARILQVKLDAIDHPGMTDRLWDKNISLTRVDLEDWAKYYGISVADKDTDEEILNRVREAADGIEV